jgi:hypothetical protein
VLAYAGLAEDLQIVDAATAPIRRSWSATMGAATATCSRLSAWPARSSVIARRRVAATASSPRGADLRERLARRRVDGRGNRIASRVDDHQVQEVGECPHEASRQGPQLPAVRRLDDRCLRDRAQDVLGRGDDLVRNGGARHGEPEGLECDLAPLRVQLAIRSVDAEGHEGHQRDHREMLNLPRSPIRRLPAAPASPWEIPGRCDPGGAPRTTQGSRPGRAIRSGSASGGGVGRP